MLANSVASTTEIITESSASASASSQTAPIDQPPRISFFGISNWDRVLEVDQNPLIFISGLQEQTEQFKFADQRIRFGLAINDEEAEILLKCTESQLVDFLGIVKDGFESFTDRPLKYCLFRRAMIGAVEDAMAQLGIKCFVAHPWSRASEQENQNDHFYIDTSNTDALNELKH